MFAGFAGIDTSWPWPQSLSVCTSARRHSASTEKDFTQGSGRLAARAALLDRLSTADSQTCHVIQGLPTNTELKRIFETAQAKATTMYAVRPVAAKLRPVAAKLRPVAAKL